MARHRARGGGALMSSGLRVVAKMTGALLREEIRSPAGMFWMLLFPAFLFVLFGFLFGESELRAKSFRVGVDRTMESSSETSAVVLRKALEASPIIEIAWTNEASGRRHPHDWRGDVHGPRHREGQAFRYDALLHSTERKHGCGTAAVPRAFAP